MDVSGGCDEQGRPGSLSRPRERAGVRASQPSSPPPAIPPLPTSISRDESAKDRTDPKTFARLLRRHASPPERLLWSRLRDRRLGGFKFRRQHPVGGYVLDFYCAEARLAVEVDSAFHEGRRALDARRDAVLAELGIGVLRVSAGDVSLLMDSVLATVLRAVRSRVEERG
ncbi:MAG: DUF559 domain-containing protein [Phycisphaerales bacterium]|nr:MAG: DUF559 domain-containing protein [Phycisphaerales bacterium]